MSHKYVDAFIVDALSNELGRTSTAKGKNNNNDNTNYDTKRRNF